MPNESLLATPQPQFRPMFTVLEEAARVLGRIEPGLAKELRDTIERWRRRLRLASSKRRRPTKAIDWPLVDRLRAKGLSWAQVSEQLELRGKYAPREDYLRARCLSRYTKKPVPGDDGTGRFSPIRPHAGPAESADCYQR